MAGDKNQVGLKIELMPKTLIAKIATIITAAVSNGKDTFSCFDLMPKSGAEGPCRHLHAGQTVSILFTVYIVQFPERYLLTYLLIIKSKKYILVEANIIFCIYDTCMLCTVNLRVELSISFIIGLIQRQR
jgi:hypothetical protein